MIKDIFSKTQSIRKQLYSFILPFQEVYVAFKMMTSIRFFLLFSSNLIFIVFGVYYYMRNQHMGSLNLLQGSVPWYNNRMLPTLFLYILGCISIGISFILSLWIEKYPDSRYIKFTSSNYFWYFFIFSFILNFIFSCFKNIISIVPPAISITLTIIAPYIFLRSPSKDTKKIFFYIYTYWSHILLFISIIFLIFIYKDFTFRQEIVLNPFYRMPEIYLKPLKILAENKYEENTTSIINNLQLMGNHDKADMFTILSWKDNRACIPVEENSLQIANLANYYNNIQTFNIGDIVNGNISHIIFPPILFYKEDRLCIFEAEGEDINQIHYINSVLWKKLKDIGINKPNNFLMTKEMDEQISINRSVVSNYMEDMKINLFHQIIGRGVLKHQEHYYIPALEYGLGRPLNEISHQYGLGLTLLLAGLSKILSPDGLSSYGVFLSTVPWLWYISSIIFLTSMFGIFRKPSIVIIPTFIFILSRLYMDAGSVIVSNGVIAYRTIFFPILLYFIYRYYSELTISKFIICCIISLFCLFINWEFGLFATVSFLGVEFIYFVLNKNKSSIYHIIFIIICIITGNQLFNIGKSPMSSMFLQGFLSVPLHSGILLKEFILFIICCIIFTFMYKKHSQYSFIFLFSVFVKYTITTYYIWSGMKDHYFAYYIDIVMPYIIFSIFILYEVIKNNRIRLSLTFIFLLSISINIITHYNKYNYFKLSYDNAVKYSKIYEWTTPGTQFKSTLNPEFFNDTITLIQKYAPEDTPYIYILSQYDSFLTFIARKYSAMPHFDLAASLITQEAKQNAIDSIKINKPEYIFVDNDIEFPYEFDLVPKATFNNIYIHAETRSKVLYLNQIREIYNDIISEYTPIEHSRLLTVYQYTPK